MKGQSAGLESKSAFIALFPTDVCRHTRNDEGTFLNKLFAEAIFDLA